MHTGCAVDVDLLPGASQLLDLVCNQLHCPWQLHAQVEWIEVPDGVSVVSHISPLYASLADRLNIQIEERHVCVFLEIDNSSHALLVCYPAQYSARSEAKRKAAESLQITDAQVFVFIVSNDVFKTPHQAPRYS